MGNIDSQYVITVLIFICMFMIIWSVWKKELIGIIMRLITGMGIIWLVNLIIPVIAIGYNLVTAGIVVILGVPGIIMLYLVNALL